MFGGRQQYTQSRNNADAKPGWKEARTGYRCVDELEICLPHKAASVRDLDGARTVPRNAVVYARDREMRGLEPRTVISGVERNRGGKTVFGGSDGLRTLVFAEQVRIVK